MRKKFDQSLEKLHIDFHQMGGLVIEQIQQALDAFSNRNYDLAQLVKAGDGRINAMEDEIEQKCVNLIALQSPVTNDLKSIITIMKASTDLERMGDHSKSIAKATLRLEGFPRDYYIENLINEMGLVVIEAVRKVLDAYSKDDIDAAIQIIGEDDLIDQQRDKIIEETISSLSTNTEMIQSGVEYVQMASYLERLGDYATNIAEWVVYLD